MKIGKVIFILTVLVSQCAIGQTPNSWTKKADFGAIKRERAVSFSIGEYGYVATGEDTNNVTYNDLWKYDPLLDTWTQMANLPGSTRRNAIGFALNDKGYVGTGIDSSESFLGTILFDFWEYDPLTNGWTQKADYPGAGGLGVYYAGSFVADNKGYVTCGKYGPSFYAFDLWEYKPSTDSWSQRANFPGGVRYAVSALSINNKGYVGMGIDQDLYRKDWWQYDPSTNVWMQKSNLPGDERGAASTFTLGSRGYVIFGADGGFKDELWEYNPYTDSWNIKSNIPGGGRRNGIAFNIGNKGYAGTGKGSTGIKKSFYEYTPAGPLDVEELNLNVSLYPNPAQESITLFLQNESDAKSAIILNSGGQVVSQVAITGQTSMIDRNGLASGNYFLVVLNSSQEILAKTQFTFN